LCAGALLRALHAGVLRPAVDCPCTGVRGDASDAAAVGRIALDRARTRARNLASHAACGPTARDGAAAAPATAGHRAATRVGAVDTAAACACTRAVHETRDA